MTSPEALYLTLVLDWVCIADGAFGCKDEIGNGLIDFQGQEQMQFLITIAISGNVC